MPSFKSLIRAYIVSLPLPNREPQVCVDGTYERTMPPGNVDEEQPLLHREISEEREEHERQEVRFSDGDEENPRAWSKRKKLTNVAIIALMSILSPLASSMFTPGIKTSGRGFENRPAERSGDHDWICGHAWIRPIGDCASVRDLWEAAGLHLLFCCLFFAADTYCIGSKCCHPHRCQDDIRVFRE